MTYPGVRKAATKSRLDQQTWAGNTLLLLSYDTIGAGEFDTPPLDFGLVFEGAPFFSFGVELQPGEVLLPSAYPAVMCGVREWQVTEVEADDQTTPYYIGASLWIFVSSPYLLRFRLSFEGITMRNVEHFRGLSG